MNQVDPVSGNPVPPGAAPEEVRDDVDAKLSTGEYVLSADVVRFLGVEKIENLVKKAQDQMKKIEAGVGADTEMEEDLELPFDPTELQTEDAPVEMATGGLVHGGMVGDDPLDPFNGLFQLPQTPQASVQEERSEAKPDDKLTGIAGKVQDWTPKDFDTYSRAIGDTGHRAAEGIISAIPGGKIGLNMRYDYLNDEVPKALEKMITTGVDLQGNKLTPEQMANAKSVYDKQTTSGGIKANNKLSASLTEPVAKALGVDKFTAPVQKAKDAITNPVKALTNEFIRDPIKNAVNTHIRDPIKSAVATTAESVKQGIRDATSSNKTPKEEKGLISRRDEEKNSKDKSKSDNKSDKSGKGEGDKSSSSKGSSKGSSSSGKGSSGKSDKDDKSKK